MKTKKHRPTYLRTIAALAMAAAFSYTAQAWQGISTLKLHVEGRYLKDQNGKNVLLHGWMQPTETWFNGEGHRYSNPTDWNNTANVAGMLNFMKDAATVMSDISPKYGRNHGWYATFVRVNVDNPGGWTADGGLVNASQFNGWIQNFVVPYADHLRSHGLYLVLCATGPVNTPNNGSHNCGQIEQQRLITYWQTIANAPGIKSADNIMFELMNEPVQIETSFGANNWGSGSGTYFQAFRNFMQPVINAIRNTGADNVIWVPCLGWQGEPHGWAQYPFTGSNIGVAAHYYPGYGNVHDNATAVQNLWNSNYKPAANQWPMMITECMWYPNPPGGYDDLFNGTTAGFGNALKNAMDNQGNVSFLVGFLADCLYNLVTSTPANCTLGSNEGTQTYFDWLPTYAWAAPGGGPSGLTATATAATQVLLAWNPFVGATNYTVKRSANSGGPYTTVAAGVTTTNYTDTVTAGMRFSYVVSATVDGLETPNSSEASVNPPYPWITQDIGSAGLAGSANFSNGVFTVKGAGDDIWNTADAFRFIYVPVTGNCTITARVLSIQNTDPWAKAGVMVRSNLNANSVNAFVAVTSSNGVTFQYRSATGGNSSFNNTTGLTAPYWVRLVRSGNTFSAYRSPNGVAWTQQGTATTISMAPKVYVGLAVTAHNNSTLCVATFDNVILPGWLNWTLPPVPTGLSGVAENRQAALNWASSANVTSYNVKRSTTNGGPYTIIGNVTTTNYTGVGLTNGTTYYYTVSALNPAGESGNSAQVALSPRPSMSLTLTGTNLTLSWPLASDGFRLQSRTNLVLGDWTDVMSPEPQIVGDQWQVVLPISINSASIFYRLVK